MTISATPAPRSSRTSSGARPYCCTSVCAWALKSRVTVRGVRWGRRRSPNSTTIATVPATSGMPTRENWKNPIRPAPASLDASDTMTFTGEAVRTSSEPACAAKASGISSCDGERRSRAAITTTTGASAATDPFGVISAVSTAQSSIVNTRTRVRLSPAPAINCWPAHDVTPVASSDSLTTKSDPMKITEGSPNPLRA